MSEQLYRTNEPHAEEIHDLIEIGMLVPVSIDYEAATNAVWHVVDRIAAEGDERVARIVVNAALGIGGDGAGVGSGA